MKGVFKPNIPIFPPNSAEGLHFSAFHLSVKQALDQGVSLHNLKVDLRASLIKLH